MFPTKSLDVWRSSKRAASKTSLVGVWIRRILRMYWHVAAGSVFLAGVLPAQQVASGVPATILKKTDTVVVPSANPEDLTPVFRENAATHWLADKRIRAYGWVNGGYSESSSGYGLLNVAPSPTRFGDEFLLNGAWLIVDRPVDPAHRSWGFRADFYGGSDAALLRPPVGYPELEFKFVAETRQVLAVSSRHPLSRKRGPLVWKDFDGEDLVMMHPSLQHGFYDAFLANCAQAGAKPRPAQFANDVQTLMWLISSGFGIAPTVTTMSEIKRPGLVFRELPPGLPPVQGIGLAAQRRFARAGQFRGQLRSDTKKKSKMRR